MNKFANKLLPSWLRDALLNSFDKEGLKKYIANSGWMLLARIVTFVTSFVTIALVARYLGPENLGKLSYAQSFVALFSILASLGIDQILIRELSNNPKDHDQIIGTAVLTKLLLGVATLALAMGASMVTGTEPLITVLVVITATSFILSPFSTVGLFFQAEAKAKYGSQVTIVNAFLLPALKLLVIYFDKGIIFFAAVSLVEPLLASLYLLYVYRMTYKRSPLSWTYSIEMFRKLIHQSWPLALASGVGYIYAKIDQVMLLHLLDASAVGVYSAAMKIREITGIVPGIIIGSLLPALLNSRKSNRNEFLHRSKLLGYSTISFTILIVSLISLFSGAIINFVFGNEYTGSGPVLQIVVWASVGTVTIAFLRTYLITEYQTTLIFWSSLVGSIVNVLLNLYFIPRSGVEGAAYATVITYALVIFVLGSTKTVRNLYS